jgi:beta-glucosidase
MTQDEKIGQMTLIEKGSIDPAGVAQALVGGVLSGGGGTPPSNTPEGWYEMVGAYQDAALSTRLGIPMIYGIDAVHGHGNAFGASIFPHNIGLGAADDPELVEAIGRATALEMSATGIRWDYGPVLAVPQDVRWGRTYEGYGVDPTLVGRLGAAFIEGLQGPDLSSDDAAVATAKHFLGDGGTDWGSSTTEGYVIDQGVTDVDDETLRAIHLAPYEEAIAAGARTVMASFSSTGAGKVHGDPRLLTDILKGELGFTGFVVSDWAGVDQVTPGDYDAAVARSISAGIDMVMVPYDTALFQRAVRTGLEEGAIAQERIDDAVARILRVKFEMGLFEQPMPAAGRGDLLGSPEHRALGRRAVAGSLVLLHSDADVLPLGDEASLLVAGAGADDIGLQSGGWTIEWQGATGDITPGTTLVEALTERIRADVRYDRDAAFPEGTTADVGIVVVAEPPYAEGLGDSATLALPPGDVALVGEMRDHVDRLIVVIYSGRPVMLDEIVEDADALVAAWLPGTEASGISDVLFGEVPFSGTTPFTWPVTPEDAPRTDRDPCDGAIFPLGYGLDASGERLGVEPCAAP